MVLAALASLSIADTAQPEGSWITDSNGCRANTSIEVKSGTNIFVNITGDSTFCFGDTLQLTTRVDYAKYQWSTGDTSKLIEISQPCIIFLNVTDYNGCTASATFTVKMFDPEISKLNTSYDFGKLVYGSDSTISIILTNSGKDEIIINKIYLKNNSEFSVQSTPTVPFAIDTETTFTVNIKFKPSDYAAFEDSLFIESDNPCNYVISAKLIGTGTGQLLVWVPEVDGIVGEKKIIPLNAKMLTSKELISDYSSNVSIDATYFLPDTSNQKISYLKPNVNIAINKNSQTFTTDSTCISAINGLVLLGPTYQTPITISTFTLTNPNIQVIILDSILTDGGMCGGEARRIQFVTPTTMNIKPNPSNGDDIEIVIESGFSGNFVLNIYSLDGSKIYSQNWEQQSPDGAALQRNYIINQNQIASGMYFVRLQMGTESITRPLFLVK